MLPQEQYLGLARRIALGERLYFSAKTADYLVASFQLTLAQLEQRSPELARPSSTAR